MAAKNWVFTLNKQNPDDEFRVDVLQRLFTDYAEFGINYIVYQHERATTDHLQGYVQMGTRKTLLSMRNTFAVKLPGAHFEKAKGNPEQCRNYCTKEETRISGPYEFGTISKAGKRSDLDEFMQAQPLTEDEIYEQFPSIIAKYPQFVRNVIRRRLRPSPVEWTPRTPWQCELLSYCYAPASPREVRWYNDPSGNSGKSYFCRNFGLGIGYVITGGKHADIYYAYAFQPYIFFDWPRCAEETFPYGVVESFKNGYFLSTKYESAPIKFNIPIVIVFANFYPDKTKLSDDRWDIINILSD